MKTPVIDKPKRTKVALYSWLTPELNDSLRALSDKTRVPLSALVAEAIEDLLKKRKHR